MTTNDMNTEVTNEVARTFVPLNDGEVLTGTIKRPFINGGKLLGAILDFEGRSETALLHLKQMVGANKEERLSAMKLGEPVRVKLIVSGERPNRKTWASEIALAEDSIVDQVLAGERQNLAGRIINTTDYGVFVELLAGPGAGRRGLMHAKNFGGKSPASLRDFTMFTAGGSITVDVIDARVDHKGVLRIDLRQSESEAA